MHPEHAPVPAVALAPFALLLLAIAVVPLAAPRWWHRHRNQGLVSAALGLPAAWWSWGSLPVGLEHAVLEYASFITMLGALYVVSAGVLVEGQVRAGPRLNTTLLAAGAVLANVIGTTGAAMLLARPLLRANAHRRDLARIVVFFIFIVCNCGGCLTPLGDPPLFVGYLRGVPFTWTLRLWPEWLVVNAALLAIFFVWERAATRREGAPGDGPGDEPPVRLRVRGLGNVLALLGVVAAVALAPAGWREAIMLALALLSLRLTPGPLHAGNAFAWYPIVEVAILFAGLFVTMVPALEFLRQHGPELAVRTPLRFFWITGALSAVLDNTPSYLAMLSLAQGLALPDEVAGVSHEVLAGISLGAVFLGAATYIGNGPNFMVRSLATSRGVRMPSFFGFLVYSGAILLPVVAVTSWLFL